MTVASSARAVVGVGVCPATSVRRAEAGPWPGRQGVPVEWFAEGVEDPNEE